MADLMLILQIDFFLLAAISDDVNTILEPPFRVDDDGKCLRSSISSATKRKQNCDARRTSCGTR